MRLIYLHGFRSSSRSFKARLVPAPFEQLQIGWGYVAGQPRPGFGGQVHAVIAGGGAPSEAELQVLERVLAARAGGGWRRRAWRACAAW